MHSYAPVAEQEVSPADKEGIYRLDSADDSRVRGGCDRIIIGG